MRKISPNIEHLSKLTVYDIGSVDYIKEVNYIQIPGISVDDINQLGIVTVKSYLSIQG